MTMIAAALFVLLLQDPDCPDFEIDGAKYRISKGDAYRWDAGQWVLFLHVYDVDFYAKNYVEKDGRVYRKGGDKLWEVRRTFSTGFEEGESIRDLIGEKQGWTEFTLQSPKAPSIKDYVALRQRILRGTADFLDNRLDVDARVMHGGKRSLKCVSVAKAKDMVCCKASISTELMHFKKGDDLWYAAWYYVEDGMPSTVVDFESTWIEGSAGPRVFIGDDECAYVELKWADKPKYRQAAKSKMAVPRKQWVRFKVHLKLSEKDDGVIELWQDGAKIVDAKGRTLPLASTILNSLEAGISANAKATTLYVDDIVMSDQPLKD